MRPTTSTGPGLHSAHTVQLFDTVESQLEAVFRFVCEGLACEDTVLLVMTGTHWHALDARLRTAGISSAAAIHSGHLVVRDAAETLHLFLDEGSPDGAKFDETVGGLVRGVTPNDGSLRIFGEMVDLLAAEGNFTAAHALELLWNDLGSRTPFLLFCGYTAVHFGDPTAADALRGICESHSHVWSNPRDLLASFLISTHTRQV